MALFGAPLAHEDNAVRAAYAALDMQRDVREEGDAVGLRRQRGEAFLERLGIKKLSKFRVEDFELLDKIG